MVSPEPEILVIDRNAEDNYLIFACDGIWDAIPDPQECVTIVNELLVLMYFFEVIYSSLQLLWKMLCKIY